MKKYDVLLIIVFAITATIFLMEGEKVNINEIQLLENIQDAINEVGYDDINLSKSDLEFIELLEDTYDEWEPLIEAQIERLERIGRMLGVD